jgi:hypothetical protein
MELDLHLEEERGADWLDAEGLLQPAIPADLQVVSAQWERGLAGGWGLEARAGIARRTSQGSEAWGAASTTLGLRRQLLDWRGVQAAAYGGLVAPGLSLERVGGRAGQGRPAAEFRLMTGWGARRAFVDLSASRLQFATGQAQWRGEATIGWRLPYQLQLISQVYAGQSEPAALASYWVKSDQAVSMNWRGWIGKIGWRNTLAGRNLTASHGPVLGLRRVF